jgi:AraC-like DNA-binding protein
MNFSVHELTDEMSTHIESIFHYDAFIPDHTTERVVPTGHVFLLFELDGFTRHTYQSDDLKPNGTHRKAWISGQQNKHLTISAHPHSEMLVVQFKPAGGRPFFHQPMALFTDRVFPAEDVFGSAVLDLRESMMKARNAEDKMALVANWLEARIRSDLTPPDKLTAVIQALQAEPVANHADAIQPYPNSQKHLIEQFKQYVGLTPKSYHRILRFNDLLATIQNQQSIQWSEVSYLSGYADQSHFIKEFKHFSGYNPKEFIHHDWQHESGNFFPLDRG